VPFVDGLLKLALFVVVFGVLIVFHELGHFLAAKLVGVRVEVFAMGFGPRLFGKRIGETDYRVSLILLGGYVRMAGEGGEEPPTGSPREFESRSTFEKLLIMFAGPLFNGILAVGLLAGAYLGGVDVPEYLDQPVDVGQVEPGSPAEVAGISVGDRIVEIEGRPVATWEPFFESVLTSPGADLGLTVERDGARRVVQVPVESRSKHAVGSIGVAPCVRVKVASVTPASPAAAAGFEPGDVIALVGGVPPCSVSGLVQTLQEAKGSVVEAVLDRDGRRIETSVQATWDNAHGRWMVGIGPAEASVLKRYPLGGALRESLATNWRQSKLLVVTLGKLLTGRLSVRSMSGPMELADFTQESAEAGFVHLLQLMALVSLNLAIFNLLPVPLLDGGRIFILAIEAIRGRQMEQRTKEWILQAGLVMIVTLMVVVIFFDVIKKLEG
jgi:regulator of sigma E protease